MWVNMVLKPDVDTAPQNVVPLSFWIPAAETQYTPTALCSCPLMNTWHFHSRTRVSSANSHPHVSCSSQERPFVLEFIPTISTISPVGWVDILHVMHQWKALILHYLRV